MINKNGVWFVTLFTLILVLSVYYVTMPNEMLNEKSNTEVDIEEVNLEMEESEILTTLRVNSDDEIEKEINKLKEIISSAKSSTKEKNEAYEKIQNLTSVKSKEQNYEKLIKDTYKIDSYVKIDGNKVSVVTTEKKHDISIANNIMRLLQASSKSKLYISVKFES